MKTGAKNWFKALFVGSLGGLSTGGVSFGVAYAVIHDESQRKFMEDNLGIGKYQNCSLVSRIHKVHVSCRPSSLHKEFNDDEKLFVKNNIDAFIDFAPYMVTGITVVGILLSVTFTCLPPNPGFKNEQNEVLESDLQVVVQDPESKHLLSTLSFLSKSPHKVENLEENKQILSTPLLSPTRSASSS